MCILSVLIIYVLNCLDCKKESEKGKEKVSYITVRLTHHNVAI